MQDEVKVCGKCKKAKPLSEFPPPEWNRGTKRCKQCFLDYRQKWAENNRPKTNAIMLRYRQKLKAECFAAYGDKCVCCGETIPAFLTLDHPNNDGAAHRKSLGFIAGKCGDGVGTHLYRRLKLQGWPPIVQLMCWNCNLGKRCNGGICPHQQKSLS